MNQVYLGLGSNLSNPRQQLMCAHSALQKLPQASVVKMSSLFASKPMGPQDQPDYVNSVVTLKWSGTPIEMLDACQQIEQQHGRERKDERWGPRTLDIDILLFGQHIIDSQRLTVPHYGMKAREFVLYPLAELQPDLQLPCGTQLSSLLQQVPKNGLYKLD
ncbi:2-amino-4-hydroxy-6-hydroxymethyldihydropteridine diphosphokinase [Catenovulum sediminis]|uniref:2-amino-4-hydroxy-6-hydroxymethyldihydropteridine pyrophosphokinase n=1 Tax=Catenovulum sediminis TaxID=1740262 RepID=A0ABV1RKY6_9ALTE|nr:2-amino-4-hydroxy-6-hydroxymethyldihydropteridine diphosphokinase [Catenovulum sediminis]